nr:ATP-binding cassette domain-containing protein [Mycoplasmopsis bovis]
MLVALYKPADGKIELDGTTISKETIREIRSKIGIIFQNPDNQFIGASVEDDVAFGLENKRVPEKGNETYYWWISHKSWDG